MDNSTILHCFLPHEVVSLFDIVKIEDASELERLDIYLDEKKIIPEELKGKHCIAYGFTSETIIQDFPLRGKGVYLHLRRRKWLNVDDNTIISRVFNIAHTGTQLTKEFVAFLKDTNR